MAKVRRRVWMPTFDAREEHPDAEAGRLRRRREGWIPFDVWLRLCEIDYERASLNPSPLVRQWMQQHKGKKGG